MSTKVFLLLYVLLVVVESLTLKTDSDISHAKSLMANIHIPGNKNLPHKHFEAATYELPDSFDPRDEWPDCIGAVRDQGDCGSCYAFGIETSVCCLK